MIGAIVGDIVGSRFEFDNHKSKDFELFVSDDPIPVTRQHKIMDCGRTTCVNCPELHNDAFHLECRKGFDLPAVPF